MHYKYYNEYWIFIVLSDDILSIGLNINKKIYDINKSCKRVSIEIFVTMLSSVWEDKSETNFMNNYCSCHIMRD